VNAGWFRGDWVAADAYATEARAIAREAGSPAVEALALTVLTFGEYNAGRHERGRAALDEAARLVDRLPDEELASRLDALYHVARTEHFTDCPDAGARHADRGIQLCRATGQSQHLLLLLGARVGALVQLGRFREAWPISRECVDGARLTANPQAIMMALIDHLFLATAAGDLTEALATGEEALEVSAGLPPTTHSTSVAWALAEALLESGDADRAANLLLNPQGRAAIESQPLPGPLLAWHLVARSEAGRGRLEESQQWIDRIDAALPRVVGLASPRVWAGVARAQLLLARDDAAGAASAAMAAVRTADGAGLCYQASRARLLAGRALAAADAPDRAISLLEQCRGEFVQYGADRYRDLAVQELRRLGQRIGRGGRRGAADTGLDALSERELEIAELVASGRTNKEIGDTLFISTRTVERHLSHVFDKLRIDSHSQLGTHLERARR